MWHVQPQWVYNMFKNLLEEQITNHLPCPYDSLKSYSLIRTPKSFVLNGRSSLTFNILYYSFIEDPLLIH